MRLRLALLCGLLAALASLARWLPRGDAGDLFWPICAARGLADPYRCRVIAEGVVYPSNPLTTALIVAPLAWLPAPWIAAVAAGLMAGLAAWGLLRDGERWRLLALVSAPAALTLYHLNWPLLVLAAWYVPWLWPIALLAKPHAALPVAALRWRRWPRGVAVVAGVGLLSLTIRPSWPAEWLDNLGGYSGAPALLSLYGLPLLALARWRDERARLLLLCAVVPLRGLYDLLILLVVARSRGELLALVAVSWAALGLAAGVGLPWGVALLWAAAIVVVLRLPKPVADERCL